MKRSLLDIFKPTEPSAPPPAPLAPPAASLPPKIQAALAKEAERQAEVDEARAVVAEASAKVDAATAAVAEDATRLAELEALLEPTNETMLDEAKTRRRLAQRRAVLVEAETALSSFRAQLESTEKTLGAAVASRVKAELNHESDVILADADAFANELERRHIEHVRKCRKHSEQTRVSMIAPRSSNYGEGGIVGIVRRMLMRREEDGLASRGFWSLK